jgi:hypothetical protein
MAKWFSGNGFAWVVNATPSSFSVPTVIAGSAIVASPAAIRRVVSSGVAPIAGTNRAWKDGSIIVTGSGNTVSVGRKRA